MWTPLACRFAALAILLAAALGSSGSIAAPPPEPGNDIIIVAGQSNAVGRGEGPFLDTFDRWKYNKRIFQVRRELDADFQPLPGDGEIIPASADPLDFWDQDPDDIDIVGFSLPFARRYAATYLDRRRNLIIVPAAKVASSLRQWDDEVGTCRDDIVRYYPDMVRRIDIALAQPGVNRIVAFHWQQGENDISDALKALSGGGPRPDCVFTPERYGQKLAELFGDVRARYAAHDFPIIVGEPSRVWITDDPDSPSLHKLLKQEFVDQIKLVAQSAPGAVFVHSRGLRANQPFGAHFNADSQIKLGERRFTAYRKYRRIAD